MFTFSHQSYYDNNTVYCHVFTTNFITLKCVILNYLFNLYASVNKTTITKQGNYYYDPFKLCISVSFILVYFLVKSIENALPN